MTSDLFEAERPRLTAFAYRLLGSWSDAEDVVQDAWLRLRNHAETVEAPGPWLTRVVTNLCLDRRKSAQATRETYVGPWLPEPVATEHGQLRGVPVDPDAISLAFLTLLERLSPLERAAYLLAEAFDYDHGEIARVLGREPAAIRQLLHRAREHVKAGKPRFTASADDQQQMLITFLQTCAEGNLAGLTSLLSAQAVALSDGGGKVRAALNPVVGADRVARLLLGLAKKGGPPMTFELRELNGVPSVVGLVEGKVSQILQLEFDEGLVRTLLLVSNPDKLRHLQ
jgi:RNA polymerase sigma-70 factor, ECF subfamily